MRFVRPKPSTCCGEETRSVRPFTRFFIRDFADPFLLEARVTDLDCFFLTTFFRFGIFERLSATLSVFLRRVFLSFFALDDDGFSFFDLGANAGDDIVPAETVGANDGGTICRAVCCTQ